MRAGEESGSTLLILAYFAYIEQNRQHAQHAHSFILHDLHLCRGFRDSCLISPGMAGIKDLMFAGPMAGDDRPWLRPSFFKKKRIRFPDLA